MKSDKPLGCLSGTGLVMTMLVLVIIGVLVLIGGGTIFNPGPLSAKQGTVQLGGVSSHADLNRNCSSCHAAPWSKNTLSDRCVSCHANITEEIQASTTTASLHGAMIGNNSNMSCRDCHTEHKGANASITVIDGNNFPHKEATDYSLKAHQNMEGKDPLGCSDCHTTNIASFDKESCVTCHNDLDIAFTNSHTQLFGKDCIACHDGIDSYGKNFDHNLVKFPIEGGHREAKCEDCHKDTFTRVALQTTDTACIGCHLKDDEHRGAFGKDCSVCHTAKGDWENTTFNHAVTKFPLDGVHQGVKCEFCHLDSNKFEALPTDCYSCHQKDDKHLGQFGQDCAACHSTTAKWEDTTFDHNKTDYQLVGSHNKVEKCQDCHLNNLFKGTPKDCFSCHEKNDEHKGEFGKDCAACHTPDSTWDNVTFDHNLTEFVLTNSHNNVKCQDCHLNNVFKNTPKDCYSCHEKDDEHNGSFGQDCAACHSTDKWDNVTFDHNKTDFALTNSHTNVKCQDCHLNNVFKDTPKDCYACHQNVDEHNGDFGQNCAACHSTDKWDNATFDHNLSEFTLTGAHTNTKCENCHINNVFKNTPKDCFSCHQNADAHRGSFGQDCAACHSTTAWEPANFRHDNFPINHFSRGAWPCSDCHIDPNNIRVYSCVDGCHAHPLSSMQGEHREEGIIDLQDCLKCHPGGRGGEGGEGGD